MYKDNLKKKKILGIIVKTFALAIACVGLFCATVYFTQDKDKSNASFEENLLKLNKFSNNYFKNGVENLTVGKNVKYKLSEISDTKDLFADEDRCSLEDSYIQVTRLDKEYQIKSYLSCKDKNDYRTSYISINDIITTTSTSKKTNSTQAQVKQYQVSFNTNGGNIINPIKVKSGSKIPNLNLPVRKGYKFVGWYNSGVKFDMNTKITKDIVLVAKWTIE